MGAGSPRRLLHGAVAVLAAVGFVLPLVLATIGAYQRGDVPTTGHLFGRHPDGLAGAWSRAADTLSYFTAWSNAVVAGAFGMLAAKGAPRRRWQRVLLVDALLMITITAIVYAVLLAPSVHSTGWAVLTNPWQHVVVPIAAALTWAICGPRHAVRLRDLPAAFLIPVAWVALTVIRGAVIGAYPYGFVDVATLGYARAAANLLGILGFALAIAGLYAALDRALVAGGAQRVRASKAALREKLR